MRVLQICNKPPYPPMDGGAIGMHNVTQGLLDAGIEVKVFSVNTAKHFVDIQKLPSSYRESTNVEFGFIDTSLKPYDAFMNLILSNRSYNVIRFENDSFSQQLVEILDKNKFDIVQLESVFLNHYIKVIRKHSKAKIILRSPNVEYMIWERLAFKEKNIIKKRYLSILAHRLKKEELGC